MIFSVKTYNIKDPYVITPLSLSGNTSLQYLFFSLYIKYFLLQVRTTIWW